MQRRVLLLRVGAMGDVLHALPAAAALRRLKPEWPIGWVVDPRWAPLLVDDEGRAPVVSHVHLAETRQWSRAPFSRGTLASILQLRRDLQAGGYGSAVDLQGTLRSAVLGRFAGAGMFAGFDDPRETAARFLYKQRVTRRSKHVVEQGAALLGDALGFALQPVPAQLPRHTQAEVWAGSLLAEQARNGRIVLLAPTAGWGAKQWPAKRFGELARELHALGFGVLVNASDEGDPVAEAVVRASTGAAKVVACGLRELIALTRRVALVVGGDTGPVHLAAALATPTVALFGPTDPARNGPWGPGRVRVLRDAASVTSYKRQAAVDAGLARITVAEVLQASLELVSP